jgi:hypothetical protein
LEEIAMSVVEEDTRFETNQSVLAAYLVYRGHEITETEWENGMCTFFFDSTDAVALDFGDFITSAARVEPVQFNNAFKQVLQRVKECRAREKKRLGVPVDERLEDHVKGSRQTA